MKRLLTPLIVAFALLMAAQPSFAGAYFEAKAVPPTALPAPPKEGSAEWKKDIETIVSLQKAATPDVIKAAAAEVRMTPEMITEVLGAEVSRERQPKLFALLDAASANGKEVSDAAKAHWNTRRPYIASPEVRALVKPHNNPAYPSGHTSGSLIWAEVLAMIYPEKRGDLLARAAEIAQHRVIAGMHYPHDVEGGKKVAALVVAQLNKSTAFKHDLAAAKAEAAR